MWEERELTRQKMAVSRDMELGVYVVRLLLCRHFPLFVTLIRHQEVSDAHFTGMIWLLVLIVSKCSVLRCSSVCNVMTIRETCSFVSFSSSCPLCRWETNVTTQKTKFRRTSVELQSNFTRTSVSHVFFLHLPKSPEKCALSFTRPLFPLKCIVLSSNLFFLLLASEFA